jgi:DNA helicase HerA-like ATPase
MESMGPFVLSRLMGLTAAQEGALNIAFKIAKEEALPILDLKDLRALLADLSKRGGTIATEYGNVTLPTIGALQRQLVVIEEQGGDSFFGEPALDIREFMRVNREGRGFINILAADSLASSPKLYATFLFWLLTQLFEVLPEIGDAEKPKLVFFFDEAHLLFAGASKSLLQKIEQTVKLVRSKGVGVYFVTQNPLDVPDSVLEQLGNRVQHALRAYTARSQRAVKAAATTFRGNPAFNTANVITELARGEALVSMLDAEGVPAIVSRALIAAPDSRMGPLTEIERRAVVQGSPLFGRYEAAIDRESAYELLQARDAPQEAARPMNWIERMGARAGARAAEIARRA